MNTTIFSSNSPDKYDFETNKIKDSAKIIRSLNNKVRWSILKLLNEKEELTVSEIYQTLKIYQEVASSHLKILKTSGAVLSRRNGKFIYYRINHSRIADLFQVLSTYPFFTLLSGQEKP